MCDITFDMSFLPLISWCMIKHLRIFFRSLREFFGTFQKMFGEYLETFVWPSDNSISFSHARDKMKILSLSVIQQTKI